MNKKGFTLIELLGVIIILAIILLIAVPNITSTLERSKRDNIIADATKFVTLVEYELRKGSINKPSSTEILKISLSYLETNEVEKDPDGNIYDKDTSYVVVVRKNGYLEYYVNLISKDNEKNIKKVIPLVNIDELSSDDKYKKIKEGIKLEEIPLTDDAIINVIGFNGTFIKKEKNVEE